MGRQLLRILREYDTEPTELGLGCLLLAWGLWLLRPDIATFASSPAFRVMASVAPENSWALVMLGVGALDLYALAARALRLRRLGTLLATFVWVAVAVCIGAANPSGTGVLVYPLFALASAWVLLRLASTPRDGGAA